MHLDAESHGNLFNFFLTYFCALACRNLFPLGLIPSHVSSINISGVSVLFENFWSNYWFPIFSLFCVSCVYFSTLRSPAPGTYDITWVQCPCGVSLGFIYHEVYGDAFAPSLPPVSPKGPLCPNTMTPPYKGHSRRPISRVSHFLRHGGCVVKWIVASPMKTRQPRGGGDSRPPPFWVNWFSQRWGGGSVPQVNYRAKTI